MRLERNKLNFVLSHLIFLVSLLVIFQIPRLYPLIHERFLPPMDRLLRFYIIGVFSVVFLAYCLCVYFYKKSNVSLFKPSGLSLYFWASTVLIFLILCSSSAILSYDLFEYSIRGRMLTAHSLNPYLHTPLEIKNDIFFPLVFWKSTPECYGPLWVLIGAFHTLFFKSSVALTSFMHKIVLFIFFGLTSFIFYKLCKKIIPSRAGSATIAFLLNPLVIVMTLIDGHNEIAMSFFILSAFYLLIEKRYIASLILLALAIHVKFVYIVLIPLFFLYMFFSERAKDPTANLVKIIAGAALAVCVSAILWLRFGIVSIKAVFNYYTELSRNFWFDSIPYAVYFISGKAGCVISKDLISNIFLFIFIALYLYIIGYFLKKARDDKQALFTSSALILLALLFTNSTPFQAWYLIWVIPFILLSNIRLNFQLVFLLSYFLIMTFWKRMSVLAIPMIIIYFILVSFDRLKFKTLG